MYHCGLSELFDIKEPLRVRMHKNGDQTSSCILRYSCETASYFICSLLPKFYQHILALVFAINEINANPKLLPNVTLGFRIYDSYNYARMTYRATLDLLFKAQMLVPNYKCGIQENIVGVIGGFSADTSLHMLDILSLYKVPQVGCMKGDLISLVIHLSRLLLFSFFGPEDGRPLFCRKHANNKKVLFLLESTPVKHI